MTRKEEIMYAALKRVTENAVSMNYVEKDATCFSAFEEVKNMPDEICGNCESWVQCDDKPVGDCTNTTGECPLVSNPGFGCIYWVAK